MTANLFVRLVGIVACVAAFATSGEAEAARCHRRSCCSTSCCAPAPVCCEPTCVTSCCTPSCGTVAHYDSCGRLHCHRVGCCETLVSSTIIVPAAPCCAAIESSEAIASTAAPSRSVVKTVATSAK